MAAIFALCVTAILRFFPFSFVRFVHQTQGTPFALVFVLPVSFFLLYLLLVAFIVNLLAATNFSSLF